MSENESQPVVERRRRGGSGALVLLLLLVLAAAGAGGWYGWQQFRSLQGELQEQRATLTELRGRLDEVRTSQRGQLETLSSRVDELREQAEARRAELQALRSGGQITWWLNEAASLASLAQQRLLLSADRTAAERLLEASDQVLARIDDPAVTTAREALARDLEKVRGSRQVDTTALVLRLGGLRSLVAELALPAGARGDADGDEPAPESAQSWWQRLPLTVRRHDQALPLPLDDSRASLVRLQLFNGLQRAQLALMQSRPAIYRDAIEEMQAVLEAWFPTDRPRVAQLRQALAELHDAPVDQALPEIGAGLDAIRDLQREHGGGS